jgi:hypothetical protein
MKGEEELFMIDTLILTVASACQLDGVTPEFPLSSANSVLACQEILRRALSIVQSGDPNPPWTDDTYPPNDERQERNLQTFYGAFEVEYDGPYLKDLIFVRPALVREWRDAPDSVREQLLHSFDLSNRMFQIWRRVEPRLMTDHANGRQPHRMWLPRERAHQPLH